MAGWDVAGPATPTAPAAAGGWDLAGPATPPPETPRERMMRHRDMAAHAPSFGEDLGHTAMVATDAVRAAAGATAGGLTGIASDVLGQPNDTHDQAVRSAHDFFTNPDPHSDFNAITGALADTKPAQAIGHGLKAIGDTMDEVLGPDISHGIKRVASDVVNAAPAAGALKPAVSAVVDAGTDAMRAASGVSATDRAAMSAADLARRTAGPAVSDAVPVAAAPDEKLRAAGYKLSPSTVNNMTGAAEKPGFGAQAGEAVAGPGSRADNIKFNRTVNNDWGGTDIGLKRGELLTPENIAKAEGKDALGKTIPGSPIDIYDSVKSALPQRVPVSEATQQALADAAKPDVLGRALPKEVSEVAGRLATEPMNASDLMDKISTLRQEGYKLTQHLEGAQVDVHSEAIGNAQLDLANMLEKELDARVGTGMPSMSGKYQAARKMFAKINTVKRSLNGLNIDPAKVAKAAAKTDAIDGGLGIIADAHTHAPADVRLHIPAEADQHPLVNPITGLGAAATAAGFGHPMTGAILAGASLARPVARSIMRHTRGEAPVPEIGPNSALGDYFGRDDTGFHSSQATAPKLDLEPPPGRAFEPGERNLFASADQGPIREQGGLPPGLNLEPPPGTVIEPGQRDLHAAANTGPLREGIGLPPHPDLNVQPGPAFEPHQPDLPLGERAAPPEGAPPQSGPHIDENVQVSPFRDRHVEPGSTIISEGGTRAEPTRHIVLTPQEDGALRVTGTHVAESGRGAGLGQKSILDAIDYGAKKGVPVNGDVSVTVNNLRALFAAKQKGLIDFDFRTPEIEAKARRMVKDGGKGKDGGVLKDGGRSVTTNWRRVKSLGDTLAGE